MAGCGSGNIVSSAYDGLGRRALMTRSLWGSTTAVALRYHGDRVAQELENGQIARTFGLDASGAIMTMTIPAGRPNAGTYLVTYNGKGDTVGVYRENANGTLTLAN